MIKKLLLKRRLDKIIESNYGFDIPLLRVEKKRKNYLIYYFRTSPKHPKPEDMKLSIEYGLNRNVRTKNQRTDLNTTIYIYSDEDYQYKGNEIREIPKISFGFNLDKVTSINLIKSPHILINGATGTGKTYLLVYILVSLARNGAELSVIDGKHTDLEVIGLILNPSNDNHDDLTKVQNIHDEMTRRQVFVKENINKNPIDVLGKDFRSHEMKPLVLVIDEFKSFIDSISKTEKVNGVSTQKHILNIIQDIVAKGRSLGVFVILASQRFSTETLKNDIRSNFGAVISLGNEKVETNLMLFDTSHVPVVSKYGGILKSNEYAEVVEFNVPLIEDLKGFINNK